MFESINGHVMNLANSIIGVSILAMPFCFKQCGIILSILMLLVSSIISRLACHFLLKSAIIARRRTFEFLAFHIFGSMGKLAIEIGMIGFLLGTCIAFFVVMGDLAPEIVAEITGAKIGSTLRTSLLMALALFCVLPLGLLRNVGSLNGVSQATIAFYCCLVLKVVFEAMPHLFNGDWYLKVNLWKPQGILQCLPIFSMALFCQTQLFEIYQTVQNATLDKMNNLVRVAVNICTCVYILVGTFGYIAFANKPFTGNILLSFLPSFMTDLMKLGFVLSLAFSFPLVIFPCRASLYSLLYREGYSLHEGVSTYIPEGKFKALTMIIVFISLIIGILIPNIELVLGLVGSTIGVMICVLFPVTCFICILPKNTNERILAQVMLMIGICVMVLGTYKNIHSLDNPNVITVTNVKAVNSNDNQLAIDINKLPSTVKTEAHMKPTQKLKEIRHEPPQPVEPVDEESKKKQSEPGDKNQRNVPEIPPTIPSAKKKQPPIETPAKNDSKLEEVDIEAIKKEDKEVELQEKEVKEQSNEHKVLIDTIQKQNQVQQEIVEQQRKLIEVIQNQQKKNEEDDADKVKEEKLKAVKEIESIAVNAIKKISGGKDSEKLVQDFKIDIENAVVENEQRKPENVPENNNIANGDELKNQKIENINQMDNSKDLNNLNEKLPNEQKAASPDNINPGENAEVLKHVKVPQDDPPKNQLNDSPLYLKIGNSDVQISDDNNPQQLLPLPIAISKSQKSVPNISVEKSILKREVKDADAIHSDIL